VTKLGTPLGNFLRTPLCKSDMNVRPMRFTILRTPTWASEGLFPGGHPGIFPKFFQGGPKVLKFDFSHAKLRKEPFFAENFKIQGDLGSLLRRPFIPTDSSDKTQLISYTKLLCLFTSKYVINGSRL